MALIHKFYDFIHPTSSSKYMLNTWTKERGRLCKTICNPYSYMLAYMWISWNGASGWFVLLRRCACEHVNRWQWCAGLCCPGSSSCLPSSWLPSSWMARRRIRWRARRTLLILHRLMSTPHTPILGHPILHPSQPHRSQPSLSYPPRRPQSQLSPPWSLTAPPHSTSPVLTLSSNKRITLLPIRHILSCLCFCVCAQGMNKQY